MPICHEHNLAQPVPKQCPFGLRVKLRSTDPFKNLIGDNWSREHLFATREERDQALLEMSGRYCTFDQVTSRRWISRSSSASSSGRRSKLMVSCSGVVRRAMNN